MKRFDHSLLGEGLGVHYSNISDSRGLGPGGFYSRGERFGKDIFS